MLPGMNKFASEIDDEEATGQIKKTRAIIQSMTIAERNDPSILRSSHKRRIAAGSGTSVNEVNKLLNQFNKMKKMFGQLGNIQKRGGFDEATLNRMMKNMPKGMPNPKGKWKF